MGTELEDVQDLLEFVDALVPVNLFGEVLTHSYTRLTMGNNIYDNQEINTKIDEYYFLVMFDTPANYSTYELALRAIIKKFNKREAIAGYTYVAGFRNIRIAGMRDVEYDSLHIKKTIILDVTREY